jgi:hypothetical protein
VAGNTPSRFFRKALDSRFRGNERRTCQRRWKAAQLPEEKPLLVDPKPPRDVVEEPDELDEVPTRLADELLLELVELLVLVRDEVNPVEIELPGRRELERHRSLCEDDEPQFQLPQEPLRRRHGSCCAGAAGDAALGGCAAACWLG